MRWWLLLLAGCSSAPSMDMPDLAEPIAMPDLLPSLVAQRPYHFKKPPSYDGSRPFPLLVALHGYGGGDNSFALDRYFKLSALSEAKGFLYAFPDGTKDQDGNEFWNATDACCDIYGSGVDDVAYLSAVIDDVKARYSVDEKRVFVTGLSAGALMAHRLACDLSSKIAAIVSMSGATWKDPARCAPTDGVAIAEVHGDQDGTILYAGGNSDLTGAPYPSAHETVAHWAGYDGCSGTLSASGVTLDLDTSLSGAETGVERYSGCARSAVELWTIHGGMHAPALDATAWGEALWAFLDGHPKP